MEKLFHFQSQSIQKGGGDIILEILLDSDGLRWLIGRKLEDGAKQNI